MAAGLKSIAAKGGGAEERNGKDKTGNLVWVTAEAIPGKRNNNRRKESTTMRKSLHIVLAAFIILSIGATSFAAESATAAASAGVVNINTADAEQLSFLPRVGAKVAQRIIDYRKEHGPFRKTTDLMQVKGFGEKSLARLSPYLTVDGKTTLTAKVQSPRKPRTAKASKSRPTSSSTAG